MADFDNEKRLIRKLIKEHGVVDETLWSALVRERDTLQAKLRLVGPVADIQAERERQQSVEGWTAVHDDKRHQGEIADAAATYALSDHSFNHYRRSCNIPWPWAAKWLKRRKHSRRRQLVIAGALIVAEIERLDRADVLAALLSDAAEREE